MSHFLLAVMYARLLVQPWMGGVRQNSYLLLLREKNHLRIYGILMCRLLLVEKKTVCYLWRRVRLCSWGPNRIPKCLRTAVKNGEPIHFGAIIRILQFRYFISMVFVYSQFYGVGRYFCLTPQNQYVNISYYTTVRRVTKPCKVIEMLLSNKCPEFEYEYVFWILNEFKISALPNSICKIECNW